MPVSSDEIARWCDAHKRRLCMLEADYAYSSGWDDALDMLKRHVLRAGADDVESRDS